MPLAESIQGAQFQLLTPPPCYETVEDPRVLPVDTKSEARMLLQTPLAVHFSALPQEALPPTLLILWKGLAASPELGGISREWRLMYPDLTTKGVCDLGICQGQLPSDEGFSRFPRTQLYTLTLNKAHAISPTCGSPPRSSQSPSYLPKHRSTSLPLTPPGTASFRHRQEKSSGACL